MTNKEFTWTKGCDMGFQEGQKAWSSQYGHGTITKISASRFMINFLHEGTTYYYLSDGCQCTEDLLPTLFHKEQTYDFSKPEWQPKKGELVWCWDELFSVPSLKQYRERMLYDNYAPFNNGQLPEKFKHLLDGGKNDK